jgi:DNA-binding NtrC family response regulator
MTASESRSALVVGSEAERIADALRASGRTVKIEPSGPAAAAFLGAGGGNSTGLLVLDLSLPELDRQRLREALGDFASVPDSLEVVERRQIAAMLRHTGGNRRKAAQLLGLARSTLLSKIRRYELEAASESPVEAEA